MSICKNCKPDCKNEIDLIEGFWAHMIDEKKWMACRLTCTCGCNNPQPTPEAEKQKEG